MKLQQPRSRLRRVLLLGAVWAGVSITAFTIHGCYGRNCEGGLEVFGVDGGQGHMVGPDKWESTGVNENWLFFPRQRYYVFDIKEWGGRTPFRTEAFLSAQPKEDPFGNHTQAGGNLALFSNRLPNRIDVKNDTCSDYYIRLTVDLPPLPPEVDAGAVVPPTNDAGEEAGVDDDDDAGVSDAQAD